MKINTVAVIGAGAIGAYFIWGLSEKLGDRLWVIADGERKDRLESDGITINDVNYKLNVKTPKEAKGADLLLIATKFGALDGILDSIDEIVTDNTIIISLLNGVSSENIIKQRIPRGHMVYAFMRIDSERRADHIVFNGPKVEGVVFGEPETQQLSESSLAFEQLMVNTPLHYRISQDIIKEKWVKFAYNVSLNQPQAMLNVGVGAYDDSEHVDFLSRRLCDEVVAIAKAKGIDLSELSKASSIKGVKRKNARYSMLQDMDDKRHTEVDMFAGAVMQMGKEYGIETPYNTFVYHTIKALEEKNDGKFLY